MGPRQDTQVILTRSVPLTYSMGTRDAEISEEQRKKREWQGSDAPGPQFPHLWNVDGEGEDQLFLHLCFKTLEMVGEQPLFPGVVSLPRHLASFPWENPEALLATRASSCFLCC